MSKIQFITLVTVLMFSYSCKKTGSEFDSVRDRVRGDGAFIINEGNFQAGNGSLSFYSYTTGRIYNDLFSEANNRPLGDVPNSMEITGDKGYILVNNSGRIEVIDKNTVKSLKTIKNLESPRNLMVISNTKAYVSSLYSNRVAILDLINDSVTGHINIRRSSEAMVAIGNMAYITSWYLGHEIMVINTETDRVVDSIEVDQEPESMVTDKNGWLWILCAGGYSAETNASLVVLNTTTRDIERKYLFSSSLSYPSGLHINGTRDTLYYIDNGIYRMSIGDASLPSKPFREAGGRMIYKMGVDPRNGRIFFTDAVDYQQNGYILQFRPDGTQVDSVRADIIPGSFCFK
jgi:DNA-binding beta-propeller fold protein YncE